MRSFAIMAISGHQRCEPQQLQNSPFERSVLKKLLSSPVLWLEDVQSFQRCRTFGQSCCCREDNCSSFQTQLSSLESFIRKRFFCFIIMSCGKSTRIRPNLTGQVAFRSLSSESISLYFRITTFLWGILSEVKYSCILVFTAVVAVQEKDTASQEISNELILAGKLQLKKLQKKKPEFFSGFFFCNFFNCSLPARINSLLINRRSNMIYFIYYLWSQEISGTEWSNLQSQTKVGKNWRFKKSLCIFALPRTVAIHMLRIKI